MLRVDRAQCGYCGGCVSLCPEEALNLAETRLLIEHDTCTECGLCVDGCPVGALAFQGEANAAAKAPFGSRYDLVVIGAGPAGSVAAWTAAQAGLSVLLLEKRQEIGSPVRCAEGIDHTSLVEFIEPDPCWISAHVDEARIVTVVDGRVETDLTAAGGRAYVLERRVFDRVLADEAAAAGARVAVKTTATGLLREDGAVRGVAVEWQGVRFEVESSVVIGADGVESRVGMWAGLDTTLPPRDAMPCAQYLLAGIDIDPACCYFYIGQDVAPGGYAWVFPKGDGRANVGLGVQADMAGDPALVYLDCFVESQPFLARGSPTSLILGSVPVALPPRPLVADGVMLVGDAARQANPLTGGGIANAMLAGRLAAETAAGAVAEGNVSASVLVAYEQQWVEGRGRQMARNYRLRERFAPETRTSREFVRLFAIAAGAR